MRQIIAGLAKRVRHAYYRHQAHSTDLSQIERLLLFVGNSRSGTTLLRSLLNAHPHAVISNEIDLLRHIRAGVSWADVTMMILVNAQAFENRPLWTGYNYKVQTDASQHEGALRLIGDKKAEWTTRALTEDNSLVAQLVAWSPVRVQFLHCVRNPYDVIARKTTRNGLSLTQNVALYFERERLALQVQDVVGAANYFQLYHEEFVENPAHVLAEVGEFLGLAMQPDYLAACQSIVFDQPRRSREAVAWTTEIVAHTQKFTRRFEHLARYLDKGQLRFEEIE